MLVEPEKLRRLLWLIALIILIIAVRSVAAYYARFTGDEAEHWSNARLLAIGAHFPAYGTAVTGSAASLPGPFVFWFLGVPQLFTASPLAGSFFVAAWHGAMAFLAFDIFRRAAGPGAGFVGLILLLLAPWEVFYGDRSWGSNIAPILSTFAIYGAWRARESAFWRATFLVCALVLPQIHLSAPILWATCATILYFRRPAVWGKKTLAIAGTIVVLAYSPVIFQEVRVGFSNTRAILEQTSTAKESWGDAAFSFVKVFLYAVFYSSSEVSYHFGRGYWGGYDDFRRYFTSEGWRDALAMLGGSQLLFNITSVMIASIGWAAASLQLFRGLREAARSRSRTSLSDSQILLLALFVGFLVGALLIFVSRRTFFPHYANILMPMAVFPVAWSLSAALERGRLLRGAAILATATSVFAMGWSVTRYYSEIDGLNGLGPTLSMVNAASEEDTPVAVSFTHFDNRYAWERIATLVHGGQLRFDHRARVRYRVHNSHRFTGELPEGGRLFGPVLLTRTEAQRARPKGLCFRASESWRSIRVERLQHGDVQHGDVQHGDVELCHFEEGERHFCRYGSAPWQRFGPEEFQVGGQSEMLLFLHPVPSGVVRATFPRPPCAKAGRLTYALSDAAVSSNNTAPVRVQLFEGDRRLVTAEAGNVRGLRALEFMMTESSTQSLRLEIDAENDGARVFGFDLDFFEHPSSP